MKKVKTFLAVGEILQAFEKYLRFQTPIEWPITIVIIMYHLIGIYWCYYYTFPVKLSTVIYAVLTFLFAGVGITGGAHRLWTHKAYKATLPLKLFLLMGYATSGEVNLTQWVREHRVHHKFSDTDADPHNANRGLFFSHIGWLMLKKNDQVIKQEKLIDMSDITDDPVLRYYNKNIVPKDNRFVAVCTLGEGWHNYHHVFPFDYKAAEHFDFFNWCTKFIHFCNKLGWAYDLREATPEMIKSIADRLGDGTLVHYPIKK